jgi:hypothetical protein
MKRTKHYPLPKEKVLKAQELSTDTAALRLLVANYYQSQEMRKRMDMQTRHLGDKIEQMSEDCKKVLRFTTEGFSGIEQELAKAFSTILANHPVAKWIQAQRGIGPIIAAGLLAHIDITKAPTAGHIWSFAGLNPEMKWEKGQKRPYNAELKQITWHAGQCFMKQSNDPDCFYGKLYREKKKEYEARNERGGFAGKAKEYKGVTDKGNKQLLTDGKVPKAYIDACARRYAVKIFLSHLHAVMYWDHFKKAPPKPFAISILGHAHEIEIPHANMFDGFAEAYQQTFLQAAE